MKKPKRLRCTIALAVILFISEAAIFPNLCNSTIHAQNENANSYESTNYLDLLQYEWPQFQGDSSFTRFSSGPAPEAPDILWKANITGIQSYVTAFNGKVFVATKTAVLALDKDTGNILWNTTVPAPSRWPTVYKIDDAHLVIGNCSLEIETGQIVWTSDKFSANTAYFAAGTYSTEEKMFYVKTNSFVQGWNFSNPSSPPELEWETYVSGGGSSGSGVQYGDGKVFPGSFEPHQMALDARTGEILWDTETKGSMLFSGSYYEGKFLRAGSHDNTLYCFNATTGEIMWTFNPGTHYGYFCVGTAVAYDMVYELNKDGNIYALDVDTGDLIWQYKGPGPLFFPGYPVIADGKLYATTGQLASSDPNTGEYSRSEFACLDAYTGSLIWKLSMEAFPPRESVAIAYGNLYIIPAYIKEQEMDDYEISDQIWAIGTRPWAMFRHDPQHSGTGQSGPANFTLKWKFTAEGAVVSSPSIADEKVYFGSHDKNVYSIDARTGELLWKFKTGSRISSSPAVIDGKVYVGPDDGYVYCLDANNGSLVWSTFAGGYIPTDFSSLVLLRSSPTVVENRVYVGSLDKNIYCLDAKTGNIIWEYPTQGLITSSPAVADGKLYIVSQEPSSGALYELNSATGKLIQRIELPYYQERRGTDMMASPSVGDGMIFASSNKNAYYGINATTGNITWTFMDEDAEEFIVCSPIYNNGVVYFVSQFFVIAVNAFSGETLWSAFTGSELYVSPTYADGKLYVNTDQRAIYILNATNGEKLAYFGTSSNSWSSPTLYEGRLYVGNNDWNVYCLSDYPAQQSNITIQIPKPNIVIGEVVTGAGNLQPSISGAPISISFVNPSGYLSEMQVSTFKKGEFSFTYTPEVVGNWTVTARWDTDKGYYTSAISERVSIEVGTSPTQPTSPPDNTLPTEYVYVAIITLLIAVALLLAHKYARLNKKQ